MAIPEDQLRKIRKEIDASERPIIFFDDDCDGLASFLMIYNHKKKGKGIPVKNTPEVGEEFARKVEEYAPDLIMILDLNVSQAFLDKMTVKVIWIDHHQILDRKKVDYYNPIMHDPKDDRPTSYWVYKIIQDHLWIGMIGMVADWFIPEDEIKEKFCKEYPDLFNKNLTKPGDAIHNSKVGELVRVVEFNMKGTTAEILKSVKVFSRIQSPYEILKQKTPGGKFIYKKFLKCEKEYQDAIKEIEEKAEFKDKTIIFVKKDSTTNSYSRHVSNYLLHKYPGKLILVASEREGEYTCSLRSTKKDLPKIINGAIAKGVKGYGGGHKSAAGACIKKEDFDKFLEIIKSEA